MKRIFSVFLALFLVLAVSVAGADAIKVNGLSETKLYELYSQVQSQIMLNKLQNAEEYKTVNNYEDFERNPGSHKNEKIYFEGKIIQVIEGSASTVYRIAMDGKGSKVFLINYVRPENMGRLLDDDEVCVYAVFTDLETYSSTTNVSVTVPSCDADLIIRPIDNKKVASAEEQELEQALSDIRTQLQKVVKSDKGYNKLTKNNYEDYARNEKLHENEKITLTGKVLQTIEGTVNDSIRLAVDSDNNKVIYLLVPVGSSSIRILEDDTLTVKGTYAGLYTYSSTRGGEITIPSCKTDEVSVKGYKAPAKFQKDKEGNYKLTSNVFEDYSRRPSEHQDENIVFSGKVLQVIEGSPSSSYRIAVDSKSDYVIYVSIKNEDRTTRALEDDKVTVTGTFTGLMTYESTMGVPITIPQCKAKSIVIPGKTTTTAKKDATGSIKVTKKNYESFARDENTYKDQQLTFTAKVIQVVDDDEQTIYRLAVDKDYDAVFLGIVDNKALTARILEDDVVKITGTSTGLYTYSSTMGGKITIPSCNITEYSINGYKKQDLGKPDKDGYLKITKKNYSELARNSNDYKGKNLTFKGKVVQVVERSGSNIYRVAVDSDYDCMFYIEYDLSSGASRILEDDKVTFKGEYYGIYTYSSTFGAVSVPALIATDFSK